MNKRALLNAVVRNVMTKIAAQQDKGPTPAPQTKKPEAPAAPQATPALDPALGDQLGMKGSGGILDLIQNKHGARPYLDYDYSSGYINYNSPDKRLLATDYKLAKGFKMDANLRKYLRRDLADRAGSSLYPAGSRNRTAFQNAATRFGEYRQLQQQNQGTLKNSLQFAPWARDNAPQVYRKLMNAPDKNRNDALQILKWQVNNRRNSGNGYV